ncbi:raffinose/stachyose/melibiose transport system permease protein [Streptosporangium becharense]|uniref:Raffinose/stachyose/melibiose transport system permease protein n=1 Tax=Streptosporangium becharense TaxID=1816182 RepID=A0A7W9MDX6_9ACTN|nr:sugar ABC transporter permease [Streptosporangium becharense]MBB2914228.1 raffinose/stachyose/melibiose transport system permease protein [Streptosporangium becharense]MBB5817255.1 raffinose/stachyose/melibiose transport system permease protein [Streptosporangium becharense]
MTRHRPDTGEAGSRAATVAGLPARRAHPRGVRRRTGPAYPYALYLPAAVVYTVIFLIPTVMAFYFALTRWTLFDSEFVGLDNFRDFLAEQNLSIGFRNTVVYAVVTSGLKVVIGLGLGVLLTSKLRLRAFLRSVVFFPVLVSTVAVGITFSVLLKPDTGLVDKVLALVGISGPDWLGDASTALLSVALVDVWKGVGLATVIYIAGILSIPQDYYQAVAVDGGGAWHRFRHVTLPLSWPATYSVIILSFIGGLRSFDLIWTMTRGGPGFTSDVIASIIYKQYQAGFFGLSTAGNVLLFVVVTAIVIPLNWFLGRRQVAP